MTKPIDTAYLRTLAMGFSGSKWLRAVLNDTADEIDRLRAELKYYDRCCGQFYDD